jgi:hypothetical protein
MDISKEMLDKKQRAEERLLALPGVTGVDVGFKEVGGVLTDQLAIRVHVAAKKAKVPAGEKVPATIDGVITDVLERIYEPQVASREIDVTAQADTTHYASLQGGISMGPSRVIGGSIFAGTLGAIVTDNATGQHAALTNFHVACVDTSWHVGDRMVQPSRIDTGTVPTDEFGALVRATLSGNVDGAVVSIDAGHANVCSVAEIGNLKGTKAATLGMAVRKRGRTTGLTYGSVDGLAATVNVDYGPGLGVRRLSNQISIRTDTARNPMFSDHGDSGSVIVDDAGFVVGLLFAGAGANTVANPISAVQAELNVTLCVATKSRFKDLKDRPKDALKDKEVGKDLKDRIKDGIKDVKEFKEHKELIKDIRDIPKIPDNPPHIPIDPGPFVPPVGPGSALEQRLAGLEQQLSVLSSFIEGGLRPDLTGSAYAGQPDVEELRAALEQQAAEAAASKAEFDNLG